MFKDGKYTVSAKVIDVPEDVSARDYLFNSEEEKLINTNHTDQIVLVKSKQKLDLSYDEMKERLREKYSGKTIFPIIENAEDLLKPIDFTQFKHEYIVMVEAGEKKRMFFLGDEPRMETTPQNSKVVLMGRVEAISKEGVLTTLCFIVDDDAEKRIIKDLIRYGNELRLKVKGMDSWVKKGGSAKRMFIVSEFVAVEEDYDDLMPIMQQVFKIDHVNVWKDLKSNRMIPTKVEAAILMSALFFYYEGFSAINLLMLGKPGCGKSHTLDTFAYLVGTNNHNCMETTLKGLVFSHAEKGGVYGVLYREKFVALLNEFMRIVSGARKDAHNDAIRRLLSTLNDAVEKKKNRSRSSGLVQNAEATMMCSLITSDNDYPSVVGGFLDAMLEDPSYMRRYSFLKLSEETEARGAEFSMVANWRRETDKWLLWGGLGFGKWYKLLRFWRYQVTEVMEIFNLDKFTKYAMQYKEGRVKKMFGEQAGLVDRQVSDAVKESFERMNEANFRHVAMACACCSVIMGSTFRHEDTKSLPKLEMTVEDETLAYAMIKRLISDMMDLMEKSVQRVMSGSSLRKRGGEW